MGINYQSLVETNHLIKPADIPGFSCNRTAPISPSVASNKFVFSAITKCKKEWKFPNANEWASFWEEPRAVFRSGKQSLVKRFPEIRTNYLNQQTIVVLLRNVGMTRSRPWWWDPNPNQEWQLHGKKHFSDSSRVPTSPLCSPLQACLLARNLPPRVLLASHHWYLCFTPRIFIFM